jgi:hypothetical protein
MDKNTIVDDIWAKQLVWFGHLQRIDEERLPRKILNLTPTGRWKRGRPKTRLKEGLLGDVKECGLRDGDWEDRLHWRLVVERRCHASYDYVRTYILAYIRTYIHTYVRTYIHAYVRTYIHAYIRTYIHTCVRTYIHAYIRTYIHAYIGTYIHTYVLTYTHT